MIRIGQGIDVHPFGSRRPLILGGVKIAGSGGLTGHSDADAVLHALTDAILGAIGAGDIGQYFPSSDPQWKSVSSVRFVHEALLLMKESGFAIVNADITVVAQKPKISPHREAMVRSIAGILGIDEGRINVKATTTDHLGFIGRAEGILALAVVAVEKAAVREL